MIGAGGQPGRSSELHEVVAWNQVAEEVIAVDIRCRAGNCRAIAVVERDRNTGDATFSALLNAIVVGIKPDGVTNAGRCHVQVETEVKRRVMFTAAQAGDGAV